MIGTLVEMEPKDWVRLYKDGMIPAKKLKEKLAEFKDLTFRDRLKLFRQT